MFSAVHEITDIAKILRYVRFVPILLQKSFWGAERKFLEPPMRLAPRDVRDLIVSQKNDHDLRIGATALCNGGAASNITFARFSALFDFRLLQQNRHEPDQPIRSDDVR